MPAFLFRTLFSVLIENLTLLSTVKTHYILCKAVLDGLNYKYIKHWSSILA